MIIRLRSRDGLERVSLPDGATILDLQLTISEKLKVPVEEQILSKSQDLLLSKNPELFTDLTNKNLKLESVGIGNGSILFWRYEKERVVEGPKIVTPAGTFGKKMTIEDMVARQTRIERQEQPVCSSVSFDRNAANIFQEYVNSSLAFTIKRGGFLYGYVDEEGNVSVEFIYEPPQQGQEKDLLFFRDEDEEKRVEIIAAALGLKRIGFIFTQSATEERDYTLSNKELLQIAQLQSESENDHFVFAIVKLEASEESGPAVHFEAFELSKQCLKLFKENWFEENNESPPNVTKLKKEVILARKDVFEVDNDLFLVPVKILDHEGTLNTTFPVENRIPPQSEEDLRQHLRKLRGKPFHEKLNDFHILLFLSRIFDPNVDIPIIAEAVKLKSNVPEGYMILIESL